MILPKVRDPRLITIRRGGTLTDADHRLLARWAAQCAEHVLLFLEHAQPSDTRSRPLASAFTPRARSTCSSSVGPVGNRLPGPDRHWNVAPARVLAIVAGAVALLTSCASQAASHGSPGSGQERSTRVTGIVVGSPMCPVERDAPRCRAGPAPGARVVAFLDGHAVASTHSDARGRFVLFLRPGTYTVRASLVRGRRGSVSKVVRVGSSVEPIRLFVDSGIRTGARGG